MGNYALLICFMATLISCNSNQTSEKSMELKEKGTRFKTKRTSS